MGVITISRQMGSEGLLIAKKVAEEVGLRFVDKQDIAKIMREYGFSYFDEVYDAKPNFWERFDQQRSATINFLMETMRAIVKVGDVVMVGRGGFGLFQCYTDILNVRIKAPMAMRIQRQMKEHGMNEADARAHLAQQEMIRNAFVESDMHFNQNDVNLFDLVIDTGIVPPESAVLWIADAYRQLIKHPRLDALTSRSDLHVDEILLKHVRRVLGDE